MTTAAFWCARRAAVSRREVDAFVASKERWICEKARDPCARESRLGGAALSPEELAQLRKAAQVDLGARLEKWAARLGAHPTKLTIRTQHARWGSCSSRGADQSQCAALAGAGDGARLCRRARALSYEGNEPFAAFLGGGCAHLAELRRKSRLGSKTMATHFCKGIQDHESHHFSSEKNEHRQRHPASAFATSFHRRGVAAGSAFARAHASGAAKDLAVQRQACGRKQRPSRCVRTNRARRHRRSLPTKACSISTWRRR